jgi:hypothetical protein
MTGIRTRKNKASGSAAIIFWVVDFSNTQGRTGVSAGLPQ